MTPRIDDPERFMALALEQAERAQAEGEVPVGAVVELNGEVIGRGYNRTIAQHDPSGLGSRDL